MRILHLSTRLILGGSQENTVLSCEGQTRLGHEVHLAFGPIYGPEGSMLARVEAFRGPARIVTHEVPNLVREVDPLRDLRAAGELRRLIRAIKPDIVHTHSSKAGVLGRRAAWAVAHADGATIGVVHTIHGPPFMPVEGAAIRRLKIAAVNKVYEWAERSAARRCHVIVAVADAMTKEFLRRGIGRAEQYVTVRSGMDVEPYLRAGSGESREQVRSSLGFTPDDFVVGTVARLAQHKGHDDLLEALQDEMRADGKLKLLWVGDGWWRARLVARAREMGLGVRELDAVARGEADVNAQVVVSGMVPPERVPAMVRAMDVLAHPSYREGLPRTVPQALLCGVCPVSYDVDGTGEACREMETGRLVPVGNRDRLRSAIVWCRDHGADRAALAARGREECTTAFSTETMVKGLEAVYQLALERAR